MYSKEDIKKAESVDIVDYCEQNNIDLQPDSERYYRLVQHDSLVIDRKKNNFYWNSQSKGGNVINFIQAVEGASFKGAMQKLLDEDHQYENSNAVKFINEPYEYSNQKEVQRFDKARDYLVKERKIDPDIVDDLYERGLIKQDKFNNVLFLWKDHEQIMGCSEQGTVKSDNYKRGSWKSVQKNSTANYGFAVQYGKPENLKFYEASIDLLSYATLHKEDLNDTLLVSMEGLKHGTVFNYLTKATKELGHPPKSISLGVDYDVGGKEFVKKLDIGVTYKTGERVEFKPELPKDPGDDWNDQCKKVHKQNQLKRQKIISFERGQ